MIADRIAPVGILGFVLIHLKRLIFLPDSCLFEWRGWERIFKSLLLIAQGNYKGVATIFKQHTIESSNGALSGSRAEGITCG